MRIATVAAVLLSLTLAQSLHAQSWEERMWVQLNKKVTCDLTDTKLSEACSFIAQLTGLTIVINPKILKDNPTVNLRVTEMDSGTFIKWITKLTNTYAEVVDQALYITDKPSEESVEEEKNDLALMAARVKAEIDLPPKGVPLTDTDRVKIALKLIEKEEYKPTDFPGPDIGIGVPEKNGGAGNPFGAK